MWTDTEWIKLCLLVTKADATVKTSLVSEARVVSDSHKPLAPSCRYTLKIRSGADGVLVDLSHEIDGHKKTTVTAVSDAYGYYPDEVLALHLGKIWEWLG